MKKEATKSVCSYFIFQTAHGIHDIILICEVHNDEIYSQVRMLNMIQNTFSKHNDSIYFLRKTSIVTSSYLYFSICSHNS